MLKIQTFNIKNSADVTSVMAKHKKRAKYRTPQGGGTNPPGAPLYDFAKISQKVHEIERIWTPPGGRGAGVPRAPSDPPVIGVLMLQKSSNS